RTTRRAESSPSGAVRPCGCPRRGRSAPGRRRSVPHPTAPCWRPLRSTSCRAAGTMRRRTRRGTVTRGRRRGSTAAGRRPGPGAEHRRLQTLWVDQAEHPRTGAVGDVTRPLGGLAEEPFADVLGRGNEVVLTGLQGGGPDVGR